MLDGLLEQRHPSAAHAGIGIDDIQPAKGGDGAIDEADDIVFRAGVGSHGLRLAAILRDGAQGLAQAIGILIDDDQACTFAREQHSAGAPNSAGGSRNDCDLTVEPAHDDSPAAAMLSIYP